MSKDRLEEKELESISRWTRIPVDVVRLQKQISYTEAISRFLSEEGKAVLEKAGYRKNPQEDEKIGSACALIGHLWGLKDDFYRTEEGRTWYDCNAPDRLRIFSSIKPALDTRVYHYRNLVEANQTARENVALALRRAGKL